MENRSLPTAGLSLFGLEASRNSQDWEQRSSTSGEIVNLFQMALNSMLVRQDQPRSTTFLSAGDEQPLTQVPTAEFDPLPDCRSTSPEISSWTQKVKKTDGDQTKEIYLESAELPLVFNLLLQAGIEPAQLQALAADLPQTTGGINIKELLARVATARLGTQSLSGPTDNLSTGTNATSTNQHLAHNLPGEGLTSRRISPEQLPQWQALLQRAGLSPQSIQAFFSAPQVQQAGISIEQLNNWLQSATGKVNAPANGETTLSASTSSPTYRRIWEGLALSAVDLPRLQVLLQQAGAPTAALTALDNQAVSPQAPLQLAEIWSTLKDHQIKDFGDAAASRPTLALTKVSNPTSTQEYQTALGELLVKAGMEPATVEKLMAQIDSNAAANKFEALLNLAPPELAPAKEVREPQPLYFMTQYLNQDRSTVTAATRSGQPSLNPEAPLNRDNINSIDKLRKADLSDGQEKPDRVAAGQNSTRTDRSSGPGYADSRTDHLTGQANHPGGLPEPSSSAADHTALRQLLTEMGVEPATVEKLMAKINSNATPNQSQGQVNSAPTELATANQVRDAQPLHFLTQYLNQDRSMAATQSGQLSLNQEAPFNRDNIHSSNKLWKADLSGGQGNPDRAVESQNSTQTDLPSGQGHADSRNGHLTGQANHPGGLPEPSSSAADHTALRQLLTEMGVEPATVEKLVSQINSNAAANKFEALRHLAPPELTSANQVRDAQPLHFLTKDLKQDLSTAAASPQSAQLSLNQEAPFNRDNIHSSNKLWKADLSDGQGNPDRAVESQNSTQTDLPSGQGNVDLGNGSPSDQSSQANGFTAGMASAPAGASTTLASGSFHSTAPGSGLTTWEQLHQQLREGIFRNLQAGQSQVRLALNPPNLGELNLNLSLKGNLLRVVAETTNPAVVQAMEGRLAELQQSLALQGLALEEFSVCLTANHLPETMLSFNGFPGDQKPVSKTVKGETAAGGPAGKPKGKDKSSPRISHYA
ncbi:MAG: flagellar hook-length control protein FliK [Desulfobacca sp.]|nr:flagellar hook-length control protein FliK [Desulfobacca sp.]